MTVNINRKPVHVPISSISVLHGGAGFAGNVEMKFRPGTTNTIDFCRVKENDFPPWIGSDYLREFAEALLEWADELGV